VIWSTGLISRKGTLLVVRGASGTKENNSAEGGGVHLRTGKKNKKECSIPILTKEKILGGPRKA